MLKFSSAKLALIFVVASLGFHTISSTSISQRDGNIAEDAPIDAATRASKCQLPTHVSIKGRHYYFELVSELSHSDASKHCQKLNMELVSIEDCEEHNYLTNMIKDYGRDCFSQPYWTSGYRRNNNFYWGTGSPFVYTNWNYAEPNVPLTSEACVKLGQDVLQWHDDHCTVKYNFICESVN